MADRDDFGSFFAGLIVGGLVGAAVALLVAPQSGEETRTMIRDKSIELRDKASEYGADVQMKATQALEESKKRLDAAVADLRVHSAELEKVTKQEEAVVQELEAQAQAAQAPEKPKTK